MLRKIKMGTWVRDRQRNTTKAPHLLTLSWDYFKVFFKKKVKSRETECKRKKKSDREKKKKTNVMVE